MRTQILSDQQLIRLYLDGQESAIEILINRHKDKVFSYIMLLVKDEHVAQDIFQDAFIKVINTLKLGKYNEEGKFLPWVMRIAHNLGIDHFRRGKKMPSANAGMRDDEFDIFSTLKISDPNVEDSIIQDQILSDVKRLVDLLPEEQKQVVMMRYYQRMSFKEIAEQTDVSINTALGRMRYALINLRKIVEEKQLILTND